MKYIHIIETDEGLTALDTIIAPLPEPHQRALMACFDHFERTSQFTKRAMETGRMLDAAISRRSE